MRKVEILPTGDREVGHGPAPFGINLMLQDTCLTFSAKSCFEKIALLSTGSKPLNASE